MSPTVFRHKGYRFFFFSREEIRMHVHIYSGNGEAKFWIEPEIVLATNQGFSQKELRELESVIRERKDEIECSWRKHFPG